MKVLITGGEGYFASRFIDVFKETYDIVAPNRHQMDITDRENVEDFIEREKPEVIIHAAAISDGLACEKEPEKSHEINVTGAENMAEVCRKHGIKMVFLSSDQVYNGNEEEGPFDEDSPLNPKTIYAKQKLQAEKKVGEILKDAVILRITLLFDIPRKGMKNKPSIINKVFEIIETGERISLRANEYRGITYIYDLMENMPKIIELPGGVYNTGSTNDLSTYQVGEHIINVLNLQKKLETFIDKDVITFKDKKRDLRIHTKKLSDKGVIFMSTKDVLSNLK